MAIKKLQNNFTTPEQSKRLLELGVPKDSADLELYDLSYDGSFCEYSTSILEEGDRLPEHDDFTVPGWSVGRLIEICLKCSTLEQRQVRFFCNGDNDYYDFMAYTINILESGVITNHMDFSKLED